MAECGCKYYDAELDCCKYFSDWTQPMPLLQPCIESPCEHYTPTPKERDVQKVRHGHWITKDLDNFRKIECKCSECSYIGISNYDSYDDPYDFNYCPNCGAKMDDKEADAK